MGERGTQNLKKQKLFLKQVQNLKLINFYSICIIHIHAVLEYSKRHLGKICEMNMLPGRDLVCEVLAWAASLQLSYKPLKNRIYNGNTDTTLSIAVLSGAAIIYCMKKSVH